MDLAYFVAFGLRRYRWAAWWAVRSLRRAGGFTDEIVVLTDRPYAFPDGARTVVVTGGCAEPRWMKMRVRQHVDLARYERVVFLDSDVAVARPLGDLLDLCTETDSMVATDDLMHCIGQGFTYRCLEPAEIEANRQRRAVCSGFYAMPGRHAAQWLQRWERLQVETLSKPGSGWDQPGLNACMVRGLIPITIREGRMWFPGRDPGKERCQGQPQLVHFHGIGRHLGRFWKLRRFVKGLCG